MMITIPAMFTFRILLIFLLQISIVSAKNAHDAYITELNSKTFKRIHNSPEEALRLNTRAIDYLKNHQNELSQSVQSDIYSIRGTIFQVKLDYDNAIFNFQKSLDLRKKKGENKSKISDMYFNIANCHYYQDRADDALSYYRKSLKFTSENTTPENLLGIFNGLSQTFESLNKTDSAKYYYSKCLQTIKQLEKQNTQEVADCYSNIAQFYETKGEYNQAETILLKAISIEKYLNNKIGLAWSYHHLGIIYHEKEQNSLAKHYFLVAETLAKSQDDLEILRDISNSRMLLYSTEQNQDSVTHFFYLSDSLNSIINQKITNKQVTELETKYKSQQQKALLIAAKERESLLIYSGSSILLALLLLTFFLLRNYRQKQRIALLKVDLKDREINDLLGKQENAAFAAMLEGQDTERLRIARELHDRLGSTLATVKLSLQNGSGIDVNTQRMQLVNNAISEVREIAHDLSGSNIERYGLHSALDELKHTIEQSGKIAFNIYLESQEIPTQLQVPLYRIIQELISNTLKHADATQINLQLSNPEESVQLIYEDNGRGFDPTTTETGMGLKNIRHRMEKWEGTLEIDSQISRGTIIIITIPVIHTL